MTFEATWRVITAIQIPKTSAKEIYDPLTGFPKGAETWYIRHNVKIYMSGFNPHL